MDVEWIVVLGLLNQDLRSQFENFHHITIYDWVDAHTLGSILVDTEVVITRGSATLLAEIDHFHTRKIIIPLPWSSRDHQLYNAKWYEDNRKDTILEESNLSDINIVIAKTLSSDIIHRTMEREMDFLK
jgi:UDP-N-acetylglucosamine:LPS N-acetylglucosamine transferase